MDTPLLVGIGVGVLVVAAGLLLLRKRGAAPPPPPSQEPRKPAPAPIPEGPSRPTGKTTVEALDVRQPVQKPTGVVAPIVRRGDRGALHSGLRATRGGFVARLGRIFAGKPKIDASMLAQIEEVLYTADIGVTTVQKLVERLRDALGRDALSDPDAVWAFIREESERLLHLDSPPLDWTREKPLVVLTLGVNGVGKTTTIGKLGAKLKAEGKQVMFAAGDTFRAAATEQLEIWGQRIAAPVVKGKEGADPSSVLFDAIKRAQAEGADVLLCDTAGRLHTKTDLMAELEKVRRVMQKAMPSAPHETLLVLDATNGQNAIKQAEMFKEKLDVTGIVLTKLDGTAKGGVILGIADSLRLPVRYVGVGEKVEDLREFDAPAFVEALYDQSEE